MTSHPYDLTAIEQFLSSTSSSTEDRVMLQPHSNIEDTNGMSFSELFSHYLAPEVAKLPNSLPSTSTVPSFNDSSFTFGGGASSHSTSTDFDPSTFMPSHIPGSPISPSENGSLLSHSQSAASPISFADFEDMFTNNNNNNTTNDTSTVEDFAIDPSIFEQPPPSVNSTFTPSPQQSIFSIALPALDQSLPPVSVSTSNLPPLPSAFDLPLPIPPPPAHSNYPTQPTPALTASGRPKRNVSSIVIQEEEEEEEDMYAVPSTTSHQPQPASDDSGSDSDASAHTTTRSTRARSSKPPASKKTRSSSSSTSTSTQKKLPKTSVAPLASDELYKTSAQSHLPPVPQWADRPDEEEYKKLSSKEKRQLRNKISARNFRHRRKEYITTLEEEVSTRDNLIEGLKDQVEGLRTDNEGLKSEVGMLKTKWQELLDKMSSLAENSNNSGSAIGGVGLGANANKVLAGGGGVGGVQVKEEENGWALDSPPSTSSSETTRRTRGSNGIARPNLSKDLPPRRSTNSWNSQSFGGGYQSVHTTLIPDLSTSLASQLTQKSFNPALNSLTSSQLDELPNLTSHLRASAPPTATTQDNSSSAFADLFSTNPFYLSPSSLDSQRASLYSRIAHNTSGLVQSRKLAPSASQTDQLPLPQGFKPAFFSSPPPTKSLDKHHPTSSTTSELLSFQSPSTTSHQDLFASRLASIAHQTLLSKMSNAFLSAFSGAKGAENARDVISGRARLQVVPVQGKGLSGLEEGMGRMGLGQGTGTEKCAFEEVVQRWTKVENGQEKKK